MEQLWACEDALLARMLVPLPTQEGIQYMYTLPFALAGLAAAAAAAPPAAGADDAESPRLMLCSGGAPACCFSGGLGPEGNDQLIGQAAFIMCRHASAHWQSLIAEACYGTCCAAVEPAPQPQHGWR